MKKSVLANTRYQSIFGIVEFEQEGKRLADYGEEIVERIAVDLSAHSGRRFSIHNVLQMKTFHE